MATPVMTINNKCRGRRKETERYRDINRKRENNKAIERGRMAEGDRQKEGERQQMQENRDSHIAQPLKQVNKCTHVNPFLHNTYTYKGTSRDRNNLKCIRFPKTQKAVQNMAPV